MNEQQQEERIRQAELRYKEKLQAQRNKQPPLEIKFAAPKMEEDVDHNKMQGNQADDSTQFSNITKDSALVSQYDIRKVLDPSVQNVQFTPRTKGFKFQPKTPTEYATVVKVESEAQASAYKTKKEAQATVIAAKAEAGPAVITAKAEVEVKEKGSGSQSDQCKVGRQSSSHSSQCRRQSSSHYSQNQAVGEACQ